MKLFKGLLFTLLGIIVLPIALICGCFLTDEGKDLSKIPAFKSVDALVQDKFAEASSAVSNDNRELTFAFKEEEINSFLINVLDTQIKSSQSETMKTAGEYIKKIYCEHKEDNKWNFTVVAGWEFLNTTITLPTEINDDGTNIVLEVQLPKIGRVSFEFLQPLLAKYADKIQLNTLLKNALTSIGLTTAKVDIYENDNRISIPKTDIINMIRDKLPQEASGNILGPILQFVIDNNDLLKIVGNEGIGISIDLKDLDSIKDELKRPTATRQYIVGDSNIPGFRKNMIEYVKEAKNNKELTTSDAIKDFIKDKIKNDSLKKGEPVVEELIDVATTDKIKNLIENGTKGDTLSVATITADNLYNYFRTQSSIVGETIYFNQKLDNGTFNISYITIDSLDFYIPDIEKINIFITATFNGCPISFALSYSMKTDNLLTEKKIYLGDELIDNNKMYIGKYELKSPSIKRALLTAISSAQCKAFAINSETGQMTINFENLDIDKIKEAREQKIISYSITHQESDNGKLSFIIEKN